MPEEIVELNPDVKERMLRFHQKLKESEAGFQDLLRRQCEDVEHRHFSERYRYELLSNGNVKIT